jgi:hypothetical protein
VQTIKNKVYVSYALLDAQSGDEVKGAGNGFVDVFNTKGKLLGRLATTPPAGTRPGQFLSPHGLAVDSRGDLYVGDVASAAWPSLFPDKPMPKPLRRMQKLTKVKA